MNHDSTVAVVGGGSHRQASRCDPAASSPAGVSKSVHTGVPVLPPGDMGNSKRFGRTLIVIGENVRAPAMDDQPGEGTWRRDAEVPLGRA